MSPEEIDRVRTNWQRFTEASNYGDAGSLKKVSNKDLRELCDRMNDAATLLAIFPETETARYWLLMKAAQVKAAQVSSVHGSRMDDE